MKLVTFFLADGRERIGAVAGDLVIDLHECPEVKEILATAPPLRPIRAACAMTRFLALGGEHLTEIGRRITAGAADYGEPRPPRRHLLTDVRLAAPVPWPNKLLLLAGNYPDHLREGSGDVPEKARTTPYVFMKPPTTTIIGPGEPVLIPPHAEFIDYELELAVVIGCPARRITPAQAPGHIAGYTVLNDISERRLRVDVERSPRPWDGFFDWLGGKWFDTFAPMGPCLTTIDSIEDVSALSMELRVNGEVRQRATPAQMVFDPAELVSWASGICTLEPGDVLATGTPAGTGSASGRRLGDGDLIEAEIEGIGVLRNPVHARG